MSDPISLPVAAVFLLAGMVKGMTGLGLPTVAMGLLGLMMPPAQAAALVTLPSLTTNVWQMIGGPSLRLLLRRMWPMQAGVCLGTVAGAGLLAQSEAGTAALGLALAAYAVVGLSSLGLPVTSARAERWLGPAIGAATGLVTAVTGVFVIPAVPYLQSLRLERDVMVQALGLSFTVSTLALASVLVMNGVLDIGAASGSMLALLPALVGMGLGQGLRRALSPVVFRRCFFIGLLLLGSWLGLRSLC